MEEISLKTDFMGLIEVINKFQLKNYKQEDYNDFITVAKEEHHFWFENPLEIKIKSVETFESKCIACSFGKTVKAYNLTFLKMKDENLLSRLFYQRSFAFNFEIINSELVDFGWCHAFLEKKEMVEIK